MAITLNKTIRANVVNAAIKAKYQSKFDKALSALQVAARNFAIKESFHNEFEALSLSDEMLSHIKVKTHFEFNSDIYVEIVDFINYRRIRTVSFNPVKANNSSYYLNDKDVKELPALRLLVEEIVNEQETLKTVIGSYRNVKKLIADLPWVERYLPEASKPSTDLIAVDVINDINAKFGK